MDYFNREWASRVEMPEFVRLDPVEGGDVLAVDEKVNRG